MAPSMMPNGTESDIVTPASLSRNHVPGCFVTRPGPPVATARLGVRVRSRSRTRAFFGDCLGPGGSAAPSHGRRFRVGRCCAPPVGPPGRAFFLRPLSGTATA